MGDRVRDSDFTDDLPFDLSAKRCVGRNQNDDVRLTTDNMAQMDPTLRPGWALDAMCKGTCNVGDCGLCDARLLKGLKLQPTLSTRTNTTEGNGRPPRHVGVTGERSSDVAVAVNDKRRCENVGKSFPNVHARSAHAYETDHAAYNQYRVYRGSISHESQRPEALYNKESSPTQNRWRAPLMTKYGSDCGYPPLAYFSQDTSPYSLTPLLGCSSPYLNQDESVLDDTNFSPAVVNQLFCLFKHFHSAMVTEKDKKIQSLEHAVHIANPFCDTGGPCQLDLRKGSSQSQQSQRIADLTNIESKSYCSGKCAEELEAHRAALTRQLTNVMELKKKVQSISSSAAIQIKSVKGANKTLKDELSKLKEERDRLHQSVHEHDDRQDMLLAKEKEIRNLTDKLASSFCDLRSRDRQIDDLRANLNAAHLEKEKAVQVAALQNDQLSVLRKSLKEKSDESLKTAKEHLLLKQEAARCTLLQDSLSQMEERLRQSEGFVAEHHSNLLVQQRKEREAQETIRCLQHDNGRLSDLVKEHKSQICGMTTQLQELRAELSRLQAEVETKNTELSSQRREIVSALRDQQARREKDKEQNNILADELKTKSCLLKNIIAEAAKLRDEVRYIKDCRCPLLHRVEAARVTITPNAMSSTNSHSVSLEVLEAVLLPEAVAAASIGSAEQQVTEEADSSQHPVVNHENNFRADVVNAPSKDASQNMLFHSVGWGNAVEFKSVISGNTCSYQSKVPYEADSNSDLGCLSARCEVAYEDILLQIKRLESLKRYMTRLDDLLTNNVDGRSDHFDLSASVKDDADMTGVIQSAKRRIRRQMETACILLEVAHASRERSAKARASKIAEMQQG